MIIKLMPKLSRGELCVMKVGSVLNINGEVFDFSQMKDGDTLPYSAIPEECFFGDVIKEGGELVLTLRLPVQANYSPEQAFPADLINVPDGRVALPLPLPDPVDGTYPELTPIPETTGEGAIYWTQLVTKAMKDDALQASQLAEARGTLSAKNVKAAAQIARIQDRIDTLGYGIDAGEATEEDEAEQAALLLNLKGWKTYKFALGKVTAQPTWYSAPIWPTEPATPVIVAAPESRTADLL